MKKKKQSRSIIPSKNRDSPPNQDLSLQLSGIDQTTINKAKELFDSLKVLSLKEKYSLDFEEIKNAVEQEQLIPLDYFNKKLTVLETIVKYLKEEKKYNLQKIAEITGRDQRNIWHIYSKSKQKNPDKIYSQQNQISIPLSILTKTDLSAQEALVVYLKDSHNLSYHQIAEFLKRDDRTIWTVYNRAKQKNGKQ